MAHIVNRFGPVESSHLLTLIQIDRHELVADLRQQFTIIDRTELVRLDEGPICVDPLLHVLLLEVDSRLTAVGLRLLQPAELVEAIAEQEDKLEHRLVERVINEGAQVAQVLREDLVDVQHHAKLLRHLDDFGRLCFELAMYFRLSVLFRVFCHIWRLHVRKSIDGFAQRVLRWITRILRVHAEQLLHDAIKML